MPDSRTAPPPMPAPRKLLWDRAKDMMSTAVMMASVVALCSTIIWYIAKPALASQFCTVAKASQVEARIETHEARHIVNDQAMADNIRQINNHLRKIDSNLCLILAGTKASPKEQAACLGDSQ